MRFATAILLLAATAGTADVQDVKHAPTRETCRADVAVWYSDTIVDAYEHSEDELASGGKYIRNPAGDLQIREVIGRMREMHECKLVVSEDRQLYSDAWNFYYGVLTERYKRFVDRHGLYDQFVKEDAAGIR
jgi:hypothetical protein